MSQPNGKPQVSYDPNFTPSVIAATGPKCSPRLREVMTALIQHVHDFAREVNLTTDEYMAGVQLLNWAGQMSNDRRNEGQLVTDVIGLESLVDEITYKTAAASAGSATPSAILGPFWRDTPIRKFGESVVDQVPDDGKVAYLFGRVTDAETGAPLRDALVDIWQASTNGKISILLSRLNGTDMFIQVCMSNKIQISRIITFVANSRRIKMVTTLSTA
jgi:catechol 1,2-dioxygenase